MHFNTKLRKFLTYRFTMNTICSSFTSPSYSTLSQTYIHLQSHKNDCIPRSSHILSQMGFKAANNPGLAWEHPQLNLGSGSLPSCGFIHSVASKNCHKSGRSLLQTSQHRVAQIHLNPVCPFFVSDNSPPKAAKLSLHCYFSSFIQIQTHWCEVWSADTDNACTCC